MNWRENAMGIWFRESRGFKEKTQKIKIDRLKTGMASDGNKELFGSCPKGTRRSAFSTSRPGGLSRRILKESAPGSESPMKLENMDSAKRLTVEKATRSPFRCASRDHPAAAGLMRSFIEKRLIRIMGLGDTLIPPVWKELEVSSSPLLWSRIEKRFNDVAFLPE